MFEVIRRQRMTASSVLFSLAVLTNSVSSILAAAPDGADEKVIDEIRAQYRQIQRDIPKFNRVDLIAECQGHGCDSAYGFLDAEGHVRKIVSKSDSELGGAMKVTGHDSSTDEYYFSDDELVFSYSTGERVEEGKPAERLERRLYFHSGRLIRRIDGGKILPEPDRDMGATRIAAQDTAKYLWKQILQAAQHKAGESTK